MLHDERHLGPIGLGLHDGYDFVDERDERHRLQLQILGTRELQKPLHHLVEPPNLVGDHIHVLQRLHGRSVDHRHRCAGAAR